MNGHFYFEIQATDMDRATDFYTSLFKWEITENLEGVPVEYRRITTGGARGGLLRRPADTPPPNCGTNAYVCSIEVSDYDETASQIINLGGKVALPKFPVTGVCWQGYFLDTEGNTFGIFQVDENAG